MITKHVSRYFSIFIPYDNRSRGRAPEKKKKDTFFHQEVPRDYGRGKWERVGDWTNPNRKGRVTWKDIRTQQTLSGLGFAQDELDIRLGDNRYR